MLWPWLSFSKQIGIRSFKWGTVHPCSSIGYKNIKGQSCRLIKNLLSQPVPGSSGSRSAALAIFLATSNFDLIYFISLLTYKNVKYLIWKIWFISLWNLKPKAVVWLLTGFMLGQSTPVSYHIEANGCIFFDTGVPSFYHKIFLKKYQNETIYWIILLDDIQKDLTRFCKI